MRGMSVASNVPEMAPELVHRRFSLEEYEAMIKQGILDGDDRVELLAGEIVEKMGEGTRHLSCVARLIQYFILSLGGRANLLPNGPIALPPDSMPEPDVTLVKPREDFYAGRRPLAADVFLLIEVSDSSLRKDRKIKLALYAAAGVAEYWIINLRDNVVEIYAKPEGNGFSESRIIRGGESVAPLAFPDIVLRVAEVIPL